MNIRDIRVQKLFVIALVLKVFASGLGWYFQSPWILGFAVPLFIMGAYIWLGIYRRDSDVSDEKFADSAYYLGFIFTITSIIFSLFDLSNIGTRLDAIAVRFGAAMVSTVLGLGVRVYLVSFRADVSDAIRDAEDALLSATRTFTERLTMSLERLQDFESRVDLAARSSVERVNLQVEALSKNHAEKLTEFFTDLTARNQDGFTKALDDVKEASSRLSTSVDEYAGNMKSQVSSLEARVAVFAAAIAKRLENTTFPDDYFSKRLAAPLEQLEIAASEVVRRVSSAGEDMTKSAGILSGSMQVVMERSGQAETAMDSVLRLAGQQHRVLEASQAQLDALKALASKLEGFDALLTRLNAELQEGRETSLTLGRQVSNMVAESEQSRLALVTSLNNVAGQLEAHVTASTNVSERIGVSIATSERVTEKLGNSAAVQADTSLQLASIAELFRQLESRRGSEADTGRAMAQALQSLNERALLIEASLKEATQSWSSVAEHTKLLASARPDSRETMTAMSTPVNGSSVVPELQTAQSTEQSGSSASTASTILATSLVPSAFSNENDVGTPTARAEGYPHPVSNGATQQPTSSVFGTTS